MTQPHILVVDDETVNRRLLEVLLTAAGYRVSQEHDGADAVRRVEAGDIDLVLLDVMMPGMDGIDACRQIRERHDMLPVVVVTALADQASRTRGKQAGADDFLTKPIFEDELLARVRNLLASRSLYKNLQQERTRAEEQAIRWRAVSELVSAAIQCRDYADLAQRVMCSLESVLPVSGFAFVDLEPSHRMGLAAVERPNANATYVATSISDTTRALLARQFLVWPTIDLEDASIAAVSSTLRGQHGSRGVLLPVFAGGTLLGMVLLSTMRRLSDSEQDLVSQIALHVSSAVSNVRAHVMARELSAARERLAAFLIHDLKNPLSIVSANLDVLTHCPISAEEEIEIIRSCQDATRVTHQMVMELLDVARAEERGLGLQRSRLDLHTVVEGVRATYHTRVSKLGVTLCSDSRPGAEVTGDQKLLTRVVENLVGNALRYVSRGGVIEVAMREHDDWWVLSIGNDGPPIPEDVRHRLFEKYNTSAADNPGRGIGLYFCRLVVEEHAGSIRARNRAGGGVRFEIRIPKIDRDSARLAGTVSLAAPVRMVRASGAPPGA